MKRCTCLILAVCMILTLTACREEDAHTHSYSDVWTYDDAGHWHVANCGCSDLTTQAQAHSFDNGTVYDPTFDETSYTIYACTVCGYEKVVEGADRLEHNYSQVWSYDDATHFHACIDAGYEDLRADVAEHGMDNEVIITPVTDTTTGLAGYTCGVCGYYFEKVLLIPTSIFTLPTIADITYYVGQKLSSITLTGGEGSMAGHFAWTDPEQELTASGEYSVSFIPDDPDYDTAFATISIAAVQLTVSVTAGENGSASVSGQVNADYGKEFTVVFTPDWGYEVENVTVDGVSVGALAKYTFDSIEDNHSVHVTFKESENAVGISCYEGSPGCYTIAGTTITFTGITEDSVYIISGELIGNIVIDVGDDFKFELEMQGLTVTSDTQCPITILSGDKVTLTAKKDYENFVYDKRDAVDSEAEDAYSAAIYSKCDLVVGGKGSLTVVSDNNNGIHGKDDLEVKNLTLSVNCIDNALKGNDSVEVNGGQITLIARQGDGIKTSNSDISDKGNQRGTVTITGCTMNIFAACDGIDAAYDVLIDDSATVVNIYTDKYSEYSEMVEDTGSDDDSGLNYISYSSKTYSYSVKYYNSDTDYVWVNATYHSSVSAGRSNYYVYSFPTMSGYSKIQYFGYKSSQTQGQDQDYAFCTDYLTVNTSNDTFVLSARGNSLTYSWSNYSSLSSGGMGGPGGMGGMGGMGGGNTDKGEYSTKGIKAANAITINNGTICIKAYDDAIHANKDNALENGATPTGNVTINGGDITIYSNDDGIHADGITSITNGTVNITNSYEGIEGTFVHISGGHTSVISSDDGVNATTTSGEGFVVSGGYLYIYAGGDGMDSNSTTSGDGALFCGGTTVVITASSGNSAIDTERGYKYTGGYVLAITSSGGMSGETTNVSNLSSIGKQQSMSLSSGKFVQVKVSGDIVATVKVPCSINALVVFLGDKSATISSASSVSVSLDDNGVYWDGK